jgi:Zn finger protein HypA/HybF involved in hydrogenase expression
MTRATQHGTRKAGRPLTATNAGPVAGTLAGALAASLAAGTAARGAQAAGDVVPVACGACGHEWPGHADGGELCPKCGADRVSEVVPCPTCPTCDGPTERITVASYPAYRCYVCEHVSWGTP